MTRKFTEVSDLRTRAAIKEVADMVDIAATRTVSTTHDHTDGDGAQIDHTTLSNIGTNTHAQIDSHISSTSNPHTVTASQVGAPALVNPSVVGNLVSFSNIEGAQADSGSKPADFAVAAKGVTNGDSHDHAGGDGAQIDHGGLAGLSDDDHSIYALLAGRSGGQSFTGGTASANDLTLRSTSHASKGKIIFGDYSAYDESAVRLGIGTTSPAKGLNLRNNDIRLDIVNTAGTYQQVESYNYNGSSPNIRAFLRFLAGPTYGDRGNLVFGVGNSAAAVEKMRLQYDGKFGIGTTAPSALLDVNSDIIRLRTAKTPANAGDTGNAGDICWDANYIYVCTATNTWKRAALSTW